MFGVRISAWQFFLLNMCKFSNFLGFLLYLLTEKPGAFKIDVIQVNSARNDVLTEQNQADE